MTEIEHENKRQQEDRPKEREEKQGKNCQRYSKPGFVLCEQYL